MAGVKIGTVTRMTLDPETFRALTTLTLDAAIPIPDDSSAVIASEGLLGGAFVEIVPGGSLSSLSEGAEIIDTQGAVSLLNLLISYIGGQESTP
jgi:phospholipid/cholesterol/gamma-HCH transport system substrate-binding protein